MGNEPLLVVESLRTHFKLPAGDVKAVDGVSFTLERGRTIGIVGESGSGKTVLSRTIMGLNTATNALTLGSVRYNGIELLDKTPKQMKALWGTEMAMVFQDPMTSLNPVVKVGRQLTEHVRQHYGTSKQEAKAAAVELLRSVRIPEPEARFDNFPHEMSGGMRQRVCIAIALACSPQLLFADEPTTALDVTVQHQILNLLAAQQRERHMTMILVTHDLGVVASRTDDIAVMYAGRIVERAPTATLFRSMQHPYTQALMQSIPKTTLPKHTRLNAISGRPPDLINPPHGCKFAPRCPYVQERCHDEEPQLLPGEGPNHDFACFYPVGSPEGEAAFRRNLEAGVPQTLIAAGKISATEELLTPAATTAAASDGVDQRAVAEGLSHAGGQSGSVG
ncbi:MAG: ABC transporter ATP-binding protein [Ilumatobacter sp.]|uniref:ABC transporter ATP-binding protein n=1 Tax=Ilumatobacter sp. TaxID=1967498 RepID=UPI00262038E0|nr:ABC transporter ATP-binding protein [Ilumatobacter sp.]MDJ0769575.1 ABC transporter ATP-binding protein [Ilumatobacter sp.]